MSDSSCGAPVRLESRNQLNIMFVAQHAPNILIGGHSNRMSRVLDHTTLLIRLLNLAG